MKNIHGVWLPDHEKHLVDEFATGPGWTYQKNKLDAAVKYCTTRGVAVDIGGHCGLWSRHLTQLFDRVVAFEPCPLHRECYIMNVDGNFELLPYALGDKLMLAGLHTTEGSSGDSYLEPGSSIEVRMLDSFNLVPNFIKIDTEGYELFVIQGGERTIKEHKPVMVVEQKKGKGSHFGLKDDDAISLLKAWGYKVKVILSGDYIMTVG